jgi:enolase
MKKTTLTLLIFLILTSQPSSAGFLDDILDKIGFKAEEGLNNNKMVSGLKEVLATATTNAVNTASKGNDYTKNPEIKIPLPEKFEKVANALRKVGYQKNVDEFIMSMNEAAKKAAPKAAPIFLDAIKEMSFEDAKKIIEGGDTAATDHFKSNTHSRLYSETKPIISESMNNVGVTRKYKEIMSKYNSIPLVEKKSLDIDDYVTNKTLDGLFILMGKEEKKIRTDPAARTTKLLKEVFGMEK